MCLGLIIGNTNDSINFVSRLYKFDINQNTIHKSNLQDKLFTWIEMIKKLEMTLDRSVYKNDNGKSKKKLKHIFGNIRIDIWGRLILYLIMNTVGIWVTD